MQQEIKEILKGLQVDYTTTISGWVRTFRNNQFIALNDGSTNNNLQVVVDFNTFDEALLKRITTGSCIRATGKVIASLGKGQSVELIADTVEILGDSDPEVYPLQPKKHSLEFLREKAHLRFRTNTFGSVFRLRNALAFGIHQFFQEQNFIYMHSPIISASDAEGAGEMFRVTSLNLDKLPKTDNGEVDFSEDFFGRSANLTVSGQLEAELAAMAFTKVYTFGPTFRAENSNTTRHLAEFWMIEPEVAFNELKDNADLAEEMLKYVIQYAMEKHPDDIDFLDARLAEEEKQKPTNERAEFGLKEKLNFLLANDFERITYTEAIDILLQSPAYKKKKFQYEVSWGIDMQSEHERYLVEKHFKKPVIVTNYPKGIKAFYMRQNDGEETGRETVAAMDILAPGIGEIIGGSQREERLDKLEQRMKEMHIPAEEMYWYLDTRRFGTCKHAGFGLGFERLVQFVTGMGNIRDVIPFPRTPNNCEF
ncbi:MAG: asparagine--tRNA ligase [Chitinophagaceae bacterium]|nr:asparagine--tRNA ligase [Chitinophagaceae bacterium]